MAKSKPRPAAKPKPKKATPKRRPAPPAAPPPPPPPPPPPAPAPSRGDYEAFKERQAGISRARSAKGREIGGIPDIADPDRRERTRRSLRLFCDTYNPEAFSLGWCDDALKSIARIEEAATLGALYAYAEARGSGKTTRARMAALWVVSHALCRYPFLIGATEDKARETLDTLRVLIRFLPEYAADFPEISYPAQKLGGIANRASGQTCGGESTLIEWSADRIVLPTVPPPANWPRDWPLRADGRVPTAGIVISAAGLTGEGIRGSLKTLTTGEMVRPDFVLLDDPQTPESARSPTQNATRLKLISADVLGMAGPGKAIAGVMPCTVIEVGDMVDEVLDRTKHPMWRGERSGILKSMPADLVGWDPYFEAYARCAQLEPPDFTASNAYYVAHRAGLEAGAEASWPARKQAWEVSAVQSAMHLYFRDRRAFWAEYMNRPLVANAAAAAALDPAAVAARATNLPRWVVPRAGTRLVGFVDVGGELLWYAVLALDERFGGGPVAYGVYPDQARAHFAKADPRPGLTDLPAVKGQSEDVALHAALRAVVEAVCGPAYRQEETGAELRVERCLVDANWGEKTDLVYQFCRRSPYAHVLLPSHGKFIGATTNPVSGWPVRPGERAGRGWRFTPGGAGRHVTFDANMWKTFVADRLRTAAGGAGGWWLHAPGPHGHRLFAEHCAAEYPVTATVKDVGRSVDEWKKVPNRDNDWFDCLVGCAVAASVQGLVWSAGAAAGEIPAPAAAKKRKLSEHYAHKLKGW